MLVQQVTLFGSCVDQFGGPRCVAWWPQGLCYAKCLVGDAQGSSCEVVTGMNIGAEGAPEKSSLSTSRQ